MNALILGALNHSRAVTVAVLTVIVLGVLAGSLIPVDILPAFKSPAVQVLTFYGGMPASSVEKDITNRMERWTGQAAGTARQESRSIVGASIIRNYYFEDVDPNGALTQVNSLASAAIPNLPPGTLPPVILPFDPTGTVPACLVALDSKAEPEAILYDVARYEVRNMLMATPGAAAPVVYGGRIRAVLAYLDRIELEARNLSPLDVMRALDDYNAFLPTGSVKLGEKDYAIDSNSMFQHVDQMGEIPLRTEPGNAAYLRDVATPRDASFIQTNIVRVNGRRQVYIPVYRQLGASTLDVVDGLQARLANMQARLTRPDVELQLVMDQSVYVRHSIRSLVQEGVLGAVLCSLVILAFLGQWRMTLIALLTIPISVIAALACLYYAGETINVMTLAGLSLAIGPLVDLAIICLENTHRHLGMGHSPYDAAYEGVSEVSLPALAASLCTLLVLAPLALAPGSGRFLFFPMALAVAFAMLSAFVLSQTFVPARCAAWLRPSLATENGQAGAHGEADEPAQPLARRKLAAQAANNAYLALLRRVMRHRIVVALAAAATFVVVVFGVGSRLKREFFPDVDAGAFEFTVRGPTGTRIEVTEAKIAELEAFVRQQLGRDLQMIISELGVTPDWSAAYTQNSGPMDAVVKVQLTPERSRSAQECAGALRNGLAADRRFAGLEFAFDAGGMIRGAMNEGRSTPLNVRITASEINDAHRLARAIQ
jgi:multidrug efflux pump subunit AcrB